MNRNIILTATVLVALAGCATTTPLPSQYGVEFKGSLKAVHYGDFTGRVPIAPFESTPGLYAVGPVADLDGEITIADGKVYLSKVISGRVASTSVSGERASFLVWAKVPNWQPATPLIHPASNHEALENLVEQMAVKAGLDTEQAFAFRMRGVVDGVTYHVLQPLPPGAPAADHKTSSKVVKAKDQNAQIVGFFSKHHAGDFVHHGSKAHLHIILPDGTTGHVDEISASNRLGLELPVPQGAAKP
jgi:alpha-acetolactate decarboxylase